MPVKETIWALDHHTAAKHVILRKYLDAWLPIMARRNQRIAVCDGFAGPGVYKGGEDGSPIVALKAFLEHPFREKMGCEILYIFIEANKKRYGVLQNSLERLGPLPTNIKIECILDDYEPAFNRVLHVLAGAGLNLAPTFAFIDPFGVKGVSLNTIRRLMRHPRCEVLINMMIRPLIRFVTEPELEGVSDRLFNDEAWRRARSMDGADRARFLRTLYQSRLEDTQTGAGAKYVRFFSMKDRKDQPIYDLFFATNHERGIDKMKEAMWKVDKSGKFQFSDATDPRQVVLFETEADWNALIKSLCAEFAGHTVPWPIVEERIRRSPFLIQKKPIKAAANDSSPRLEILNPAGVRKNTIGALTQIRFGSVL